MKRRKGSFQMAWTCSTLDAGLLTSSPAIRAGAPWVFSSSPLPAQNTQQLLGVRIGCQPLAKQNASTTESRVFLQVHRGCVQAFGTDSVPRGFQGLWPAGMQADPAETAGMEVQWRRIQGKWDRGWLTYPRSPSSAILPVFGGGFPYYRRLQKKGTLILPSPLEDLVPGFLFLFGTHFCRA